MKVYQLILLGIILVAILSTILVFVNTIVTKKWRNKVINESECWKWGIIYYNPIDERTFLPKRTGLGLTLNFARPISIIIVGGFLVFIIISLIYSSSK
jgi:uncharacterized membrane protein